MSDDDRTVHLHLVSDATGETAMMLARAALAQFEGVVSVEHLWPLVRSQNQLRRVLDGVETHPGVVFYTLVEGELRRELEAGCRVLGAPTVALLDPIIATLGGYLGLESRNLPGRQHVMDAQYFQRIEAMNFALTHDDGQSPGSLNLADIVLVGVSRTSKTPTCFYLANRGLKAANVPIVPGCEPPDALLQLNKPLVVGLTRGADQLVDIRRSRLRTLGRGEETDYVDPEAVDKEVREARRLFSRAGWPVIDVSRRSIEETAAAILQLYARQVGEG
ncbi:MAG: pyruvate, water dikinase regulatory protein [Alphaproteobacteria bacterium]